MKYLIVLLLSLPLLGLTHSPDEAFFTIHESNDTLIVKAELPWTAKQGLLTFSPELKASKKISDYKNAFFQYVQSSFLIENDLGNLLNLISVDEIHIEGAHTDQNNFIFKFLGNSPRKITNTILFNTFKSQQNYHYLSNEKSNTHITTTENPSFKIPQKNYTLFLLIGIALVLILSGTLYYTRKKSQ